MDRLSQKYWKIVAPLLVICAGVLWGIIGIFSNALSENGLNALQISGVRCLVAGTILFSFLLLTNRNYLHIKLRDSWIFIGTGIFSIALFNVFYFICISRSSLAIASILLYTAPSFVIILSYFFFQEGPTVQKGIAIVLAFLGCLFTTGFIGGGENFITIGTLLIGLSSGITYALYTLIGRVALGRYNWLTVITYTFLFASVALFPFLKISNVLNIIFVKKNVALNIILLGGLSTLLPFLLYTKGLEHMDTGKAAILTFVEPMVATIIGITVFKEVFTKHIAIGILLVISSIILINYQKS